MLIYKSEYLMFIWFLTIDQVKKVNLTIDIIQKYIMML